MTEGPALDEALAYLDDHIDLEKAASGRFGPPTLDRMAQMTALMGDPQAAAPVIHLTGTNGKGSTARMITALLAAHGLSVGTYTSPHLERLHERIAVNGTAIDDDALAGVLEAVSLVERESGVRATWFEVMTLAAFRWFADEAVDVAVVEVGLAGRWDATNVADGIVAVVTNVGLDHTAILGPTRAHVAAEKAGIVKPGATLVLGEADPALAATFEERGPAAIWRRGPDFDCVENRLAVGGRLLDLRTPAQGYEEVFLPLHGRHQGDNAACAVAAVEAFFARPVADEVTREALASVVVPGRFEIVRRRPLVVLDGAHNPDGARAAAATVEDLSVAGGRLVVVGMMGDRDPDELLEALGAREASLVVACAVDWPRAMPAEQVADAARRLGVPTRVGATVAAAVNLALAAAEPADLVLVSGSLRVIGAARTHLLAEG